MNGRVLEAGATVDLRADWALSPDATIWLAGSNLLDEDLEVSETGSGVAGFGPPRTFAVGVRVSR